MAIMEGTTALKVWQGDYSFAVDGGSKDAPIVLRSNDGPLPIGSYVIGGILDVATALDSGGSATAALHVNGANDLVTATAFGSAPWSTTGNKSLIPVATGATAIELTAARQPTRALRVDRAAAEWVECALRNQNFDVGIGVDCLGRQIHRNAEPEDERPLQRIEPGLDQPSGERLALEIDAREGRPSLWRDGDRCKPLAFPCLRCRMIDLEYPQLWKRVAIGEGVEARAEHDQLRHTAFGDRFGQTGFGERTSRDNEKT